MGRAMQTGVTLLELLVAMAILGILLGLALPSFNTFLANSRVRAVSDGIYSGLQIARMEALKRNEPTAFILLDGNNWMVNRAYNATANPSVAQASISATANASACDGGATEKAAYEIQKSCGEGTGATVTTNFSPANVVTFDAQGRQSPAATAAPQIDISVSGAATSLRILIPAGGQVRLCDPNASGNDPRNCNL